MATTLYMRDTPADTHLGTDNANLRGTNVGWTSREMLTTRGPGVVASDNTATVNGATPGVEVAKTSALEWISPPISAAVTISGTITANIWAEESNMSANVAINVVIEIIRASTTTTRNSNTIQALVTSTRVTEVAIGAGARTVNNFTTGMTSGAYTGQTANRGDRLRVRIFGDDAGTMNATYTFDIGYSGTTVGADGDTYVTFAETITFESAPAGSVLYLTNVQSGLSAAPALISDFSGGDENPLSEGGNWANLNSSSNNLKKVSAAVTGNVVGESNSYWTPSNFGPDLEAYISFPTLGAGGISCRVQGEGGANTWDGYRVRNNVTTTQIQRVDNAVVTTLLTVNTSWANGDKLGVRLVGSTIQAWRQASGSSDWNLLCTVIDSTYASAGKIGLYASSTTMRMDDFYAATGSSLLTQQAWTSRGGGVVSYFSDTDVGWVAPLYTTDWYTKQLTAFTLTGLATANIRALESNALANASIRCEIAVVNSDGTNPTVWASWCIAPTTTDNGELTGAEVARTANISGGDLAVTAGQRLRIRLYLDDISSAVMADGYTVQPFFNGASGGASGDTFVTLAQTLTELITTRSPRNPAVNFQDPAYV